MQTEKLNPSARAFMSQFNLKYPIVQAPTAGPAGARLAIAVANAGAMGALPLTWTPPQEVYELVKQVKAATSGSFFINYVLNFKPKSLDRALDAGASIVQFSWGMPDKALVAQVRTAGAKMGIQVTGRASTEMALAAGADYLVCQGLEAGGHVQASKALADILEDVLAVAADTPVLAAGGLASGHDIRKVLARGAAGAMLGTRFVATQESAAHPDYKQALLAAGENETVYTICLNKSWVAPHRILRNKTLAMWEAAGCPLPGKRPGEHDIVAYEPDGSPIERYQDHVPVEGMIGDVLDLGVYAGQGVAQISDLPSASSLIRRLWQEYGNEIA